MFVANEAQREDFYLNMTNDHPIRVAEREATSRYNLAVENGEIIPGAYSSGESPQFPNGSGCNWGDGNCIRHFSENVEGVIHTGQLHPCYVADCIGNNDETNALLQARANKTMNDLLNTASVAAGVGGIAYDLAGRTAPATLGVADAVINGAQLGAAFDQGGVQGGFENLMGLILSKGAGHIGTSSEIHPVIGPLLELGYQQGTPQAIKKLKDSHEEKK